MTKQEYIQQIENTILTTDLEIGALYSKISALRREKNELIHMEKGTIPQNRIGIDYLKERKIIDEKIFRTEKEIEEIKKFAFGRILTSKRIFLFEQLLRLREIKSIEEQTKGLKELIDDLFITSTLGTHCLPTHFMDLYFTKDIITNEINREVYRESGTPIFKELEKACAGLVSSKSMKDKQIDYVTAKIISCVRLQDELKEQENYYKDYSQIKFTNKMTAIEFDEDSKIVYGDILKLLSDSKVLNRNKDFVKLATTIKEMQIATYTQTYHYELNEETNSYEQVKDVIYSSNTTEFIFDEHENIIGIKLKEKTATKEDIIAEYQKVEQMIMQDKEKALNNL